MALREILRAQGECGGMKGRRCPLYPRNHLAHGSTDDISGEDNEFVHERWCNDLASQILCIFVLDRFGDFVSDQVGSLHTHTDHPTDMFRWLLLLEKLYRKRWRLYLFTCPDVLYTTLITFSCKWFVKTSRYRLPPEPFPHPHPEPLVAQARSASPPRSRVISGKSAMPDYSVSTTRLPSGQILSVYRSRMNPGSVLLPLFRMLLMQRS
jgi:hypothetical protein